MLTAAKRPDSAPSLPFDSNLLDRLMDQAGIDVVLATSKHNVQYLLGGHRTFFFDYTDAMGASRYLPVLAYPKGAAEKASYIGHGSEGFQHEINPLWTLEVKTSSSGSIDSTQKTIDHIRRLGLKPRRIGVELPFLPADAAMLLQKAFPDSEIVDALLVLERLRARKTSDELEKLRLASDRIIDSMLAVIKGHGPGTTKQELVDALRREETNRGLIFEYCLITAGTSHNRAPSNQKWQSGEILSIDSGGNYHGYIGDLCRMAILGKPDAEMEDMLLEIEAVQRAAMKAIKPGALGGEVYEAALRALDGTKQRDHLEFLAHGMGLVSHESPRLTNRSREPYAAEDARLPLESRMVLSVETTLHHPRRGFIKLEDTVAVTESGFEVYGDKARGWNRGGRKIARG
jgi:Xaa-Pro aminopeptidase